jgi:Druantia protein DruA
VIEAQRIQGRRIGSAEVAEIKQFIQAHPSWSRWRLSRALAQNWQWYATSGELKDMAARALLLKLHERGLIVLPAPRRAPVTRGTNAEPGWLESLRPQPLVASLSSLLPLQIQVVDPKQPDYGRFQAYLCHYHYLGFRGPVGENIGYWVRSAAGIDLACLLFGAAAWQCAARDRWIGWSGEQRAQRLALIANNSRYLLLPYVRVPGLASHILGRIARRIDLDWQKRYRHRIHLLETFVQPDRFLGTCYQAANWSRVGRTTGRTRQSQRHRDNEVHGPVKDVYLYPLSSDARRHLCG